MVHAEVHVCFLKGNAYRGRTDSKISKGTLGDRKRLVISNGLGSFSSVAEQDHLFCWCTGMAGSGKTTLVQQINSYMGIHKKVGYLINLDPAVRSLPYDPHIDIRDTVRSYLSNSSVARDHTVSR
jgi:hypothetical protein